MSYPLPRLRFLGLALASVLVLSTSAAEPAADSALLPTEVMPKSAQALLLDANRVGNGYVAVGERGHVLLSSDGRSWKQVAGVPTRSTLATIATVGDALWVAGHDGVILHSKDAGRTWTRQRVAPWSIEDTDPTHGIPILDLLFTDAQHGYAVGAFSLLLETSDGGATWMTRSLQGEAGAAPEAETAAASQAAEPPPSTDAATEDDADAWNFSADELALEEESDPHLNAIARTASGGLVIVGERGTVYRSRDNGATWQRSKLPYQGSMLGVLAWDGEHVLVFGLRGNVFESQDLGDTWTQVDSGVGTSLMGGTALADGGAVLVGAEGTVLRRDRADGAFRRQVHLTKSGETPTLATALPGTGNDLLVFGDRGVGHQAP